MIVVGCLSRAMMAASEDSELSPFAGAEIARNGENADLSVGAETANLHWLLSTFRGSDGDPQDPLGVKTSQASARLQPKSFSTTASRATPACSATSLRMPFSVPVRSES